MNEFNALIRGLRSIQNTKNPGSKSGAGTDVFASHGRPGAQVALLQSLILPAVIPRYRKKRLFRGLPIDKPHTRILRFNKFPSALSEQSAVKKSVSVFCAFSAVKSSAFRGLEVPSVSHSSLQICNVTERLLTERCGLLLQSLEMKSMVQQRFTEQKHTKTTQNILCETYSITWATG